MKKSDIQRARNSLQNERTRLRELRTLVEADEKRLRRDDEQIKAERHAVNRERTALITILRTACSRYGDNAWSDDDDLARVLTHHLLDPLQRREATQLARLELANESVRRLLVDAEGAPTRPQALPAAPPAAPGAPRRALGPLAVSEAARAINGHRPRAEELPGGSWRPACSCNWHGITRPSLQQAAADADHHARVGAAPAPAVRRTS